MGPSCNMRVYLSVCVSVCHVHRQKTNIQRDKLLEEKDNLQLHR